MNNFSTLGLSASLLKALPELGIETPSQIQQKAIPILLNENRDFIGLAQTGTGKTAAFGLPLLDFIDPDKNYTQSLILAPTRELGQQIANQLTAFSKYLPAVNVLAVYGGAPIVQQIKALRNTAHIIIATPGRLIDLIKRKAVNLDKLNYLVLDEADEMLNMGFQEDLDIILSTTPAEKRTWLFSATMPKEIRNITSRYMDKPAEVAINSGNSVNENIEHQYTVIKGTDKKAALKRFMDINPEMIGLVFCRTKIDTQQLADELGKEGYLAEALHGDLSQNQRDHVMKKFKAHALKLLIATDVAARGIDVNNLTHVIHYALPDDAEYYTHRSGRTARAGKKGISLALVSRNDTKRLTYLEKKLKISFEKVLVPNNAEIKENRLMDWATNLATIEIPEEVNSASFTEAQALLEGLSKQELIHKLMGVELKKVSHEGLDRDLNDLSSGKEQRGSRRDAQRFFMNIGSMDEVSKGEFIEFICEHTELKRNDIGTINLEKTCTFFEVDQKHASLIKRSFKGMSVNGRRLKVNQENGGSEKRDSGNQRKKKKGNKRRQWAA